MRILIACERSGVVREAFRARGHDAWSCDLEPADDASPFHIQGDALRVIDGHIPLGMVGDSAFRSTPMFRRWDLLIAHPPCTYLSVSGLHWNGRVTGRAEKSEQALEFVRTLMAAPIPRICLENPVGLIGSRIAPATQWVQPYEFGDDASKRTGLWLKGLAPLTKKLAARVAGRMVNGRERWSNQTDSGQNRLGPSPDRARLRSQTYPGIAAAMARTWG
jgi:hypothetical protein